MVIISKGKSVRVTAEPEKTKEEIQTQDLVEQMRSDLHELNETEEEKKKREEEEEKAQDEEDEKEDED